MGGGRRSSRRAGEARSNLRQFLRRTGGVLRGGAGTGDIKTGTSQISRIYDDVLRDV
jgi:hypothetical protein